MTNKKTLKTYLSREEYEQIKKSASKLELSLSSFGKAACLGVTLPSLEHQGAMLELKRLRGELNRLGGSLKQALADGKDKHTIDNLLHELDVQQREIQKTAALIKGLV